MQIQKSTPPRLHVPVPAMDGPRALGALLQALYADGWLAVTLDRDKRPWQLNFGKDTGSPIRQDTHALPFRSTGLKKLTVRVDHAR